MISSCRFSKTIKAPLRFVYEWCTDYRDDDYKLTGAKVRRSIIDRTKNRVVFVTQHKGTNIGTTVGIVTLRPPNSWRLNAISSQRIGMGEYRLKKLGPKSTRLDILVKFKWKMARGSSRTELFRHLDEVWGKYASALENEYERKQRLSKRN